MDDVLIFCSSTSHDVNTIFGILGVFSIATGMEINEGKSTMTTHGMDVGEERQVATLFPYIRVTLDAGFKYLGFCLKPNNYLKKDWTWLIEKLEKRLLSWSHRWLSRAGRLILVKSVLEAIPVYWMSLSWIPMAILEKARRICLHFLWSGHKNASVTPWVIWEMIASPKSQGGWGLKNIFLFARVLVVKGGWRLIHSDNLWTRVMIEKYITPESIVEWIRRPQKCHKGGSVIWKAVIKSFNVIEDALMWKVGNVRRVRVGIDPWLGSDGHFRLSKQLVASLRHQGVHFLFQLARFWVG